MEVLFHSVYIAFFKDTRNSMLRINKEFNQRDHNIKLSICRWWHSVFHIYYLPLFSNWEYWLLRCWIKMLNRKTLELGNLIQKILSLIFRFFFSFLFLNPVRDSSKIKPSRAITEFQIIPLLNGFNIWVKRWKPANHQESFSFLKRL